MLRRQAWIVLMVVAAGVLLVVGASSIRAASPRQGIVSVPAAVVTEGLTADEHIQDQMETTGRLLRDLPAASQRQSVRIPIAPDELRGIDETDRSVSPLPIGFVKPMAPAVEISGLELSAVSRSPRRGLTARAFPTADGGAVWALEVNADQAGGLRLHMDNVNLPEGVELFVYTMSGESYGPFRGYGPDGTGEFWAPSLFGSQALVQIQAPPSATGSLDAVTLRIAEVGIITPRAAGVLNVASNPAAANFCGNPSCIIDASCQAGANSIMDAYAKMEWVAGAFIYTCTGGLLNDTNPSSTNYFLTANHCLSKANTAKNVNFYWRFRTSSCNGACPSNNGWPYKTVGSGVASTNRRGDYTLLTLNTAPPAGSVRLGFTNAAVANTNGVALHRVSNPNFGPQVYNEQTVNTSAPTCSGWPRGERIYSRDTLGGTDGGSSGSPVVNGSDQVVGQLSGACGTNVGDPCDAASNATVDGALAYYWTSVQPFLAP